MGSRAVAQVNALELVGMRGGGVDLGGGSSDPAECRAANPDRWQGGAGPGKRSTRKRPLIPEGRPPALQGGSFSAPIREGSWVGELARALADRGRFSVF